MTEFRIVNIYNYVSKVNCKLVFHMLIKHVEKCFAPLPQCPERYSVPSALKLTKSYCLGGQFFLSSTWFRNGTTVLNFLVYAPLAMQLTSPHKEGTEKLVLGLSLLFWGLLLWPLLCLLWSNRFMNHSYFWKTVRTSQNISHSKVQDLVGIGK